MRVKDGIQRDIDKRKKDARNEKTRQEQEMRLWLYEKAMTR